MEGVKMKQIHVTKVSGIIEQTNGTFFGGCYVKANGEVRVFGGRTKVKRYLKGGQRPYNIHATANISYWDRAKRNYRNIPLHGLATLNAFGNKYEVVHDEY